MKDPTLVERIERYFRLKGEWICGGEIQKLAASIGFEPQNAGRRLRELVNDGVLQVEYRKGQNGAKVAWYRYKQKEVVRSQYVEREGRMIKIEQLTWV